jgi:putative FmdB family regulatory protein
MPIYEYQCLKCRFRFEVLVLTETRPTCPSCQSEEAERLMSSFAVNSRDIRQRRVRAKRLENRPEARAKAIAEFEEFKRSHD